MLHVALCPRTMSHDFPIWAIFLYASDAGLPTMHVSTLVASRISCSPREKAARTRAYQRREKELRRREAVATIKQREREIWGKDRLALMRKVENLRKQELILHQR